MENIRTVKFFKENKISKEDFANLSKSLQTLENNSFYEKAFTVDNLEYEFIENPYSIIYFYYIEGELVGYLDYWVTFDTATIFRIGVDSRYQNKGIASKLMEKMIEDIKKLDDEVFCITLEVRVSNIKAQKLYSKFDFIKFTTKPNYYENGEDALVMGRNM